jgi:hypothetical protein
MSHPVSFDLERPETFQRAHAFLRVALLIVIGWIAHPIGLLWLGLPVVAAILISLDGGRRYLDEHGPTVTFVLGWILAAVAYLALLTDRLPGRPSIIVLALLVFAGAIAWVLAAVLVLVDERYPESLWRFPARDRPLGGVPARLPLLARRPLPPLAVARAHARDSTAWGASSPFSH